jgi:hypothetical protein
VVGSVVVVVAAAVVGGRACGRRCAKSRQHHVIDRDFFVAEKFRDGLFRHDLVLEGFLAEDVPEENKLAEVVLAPFDCVKVVWL